MRYVKKDGVSKFVIDTDLIYIRFLLNAKEREIDANAKTNEKLGGGVRFGGSEIQYIEPMSGGNGNKQYKDDDDDDDEDENGADGVIIGGELSLDVLNAMEI